MSISLIVYPGYLNKINIGVTVFMGTEKESLNNLREELSREEGLDKEVQGVYKYADKPGLDIEGGKYRVLGAVTENPVYIRKGPGTNITVSCGYYIEEVATGKRLMMTKREGVMLAYKYGMQNAFIIYRTRAHKDEDGNVIKKSSSIYLMPYPLREESFTQDDRLVFVFKYGVGGKIQYPLELLIKEEQCTPDFWALVQQMYKTRKESKRRGNVSRKTEKQSKQRMLELEAEISKFVITNPFED